MRKRRDVNKEHMKRGNSTSLRDCSRRRKHFAGSVDGICDLPDSVLSHILSFLPTKDAVSTHILSQRWKFLWTMTNNLDFCCRSDKIDQYVIFVNYVLLLHKPGYLNRLSLTWNIGCIPYCVNAWISTAIARNVRDLFLCFGLSKLSIHVQRSIFSCESLQSLDLTGNICISNEIVVSLPKLESLTLISISFWSEETLCKLLSGCPVLKYLCLEIDIIKTMENCQLDLGNDIEFRCIISSDSLRRLMLCAYDETGSPICAPVCSVQLDAPLLEYIRLDHISSICIHQSPVFLVEANIQLFCLDPGFEDQNYLNSVVKAFRTFDCVKTLTLSPQVFKALSRGTIEMKTRFNNLTRLDVKRVWNWSALQEFITLADCLEVLTINTDDFYLNHYDEDGIGPKSDLVPRCLSDSLRTVSIDDYEGHEEEVAMVSYILKHGSVLEVMHIRLGVCDIKINYKLVKEVSQLPRKSPVCRFEFHDNI